MISNILKKAEKWDDARCEFSYDLAELARLHLPETVAEQDRGTGLHAVHGPAPIFLLSLS